MPFTCKKCGAAAEHPGHLCSPSGEPVNCKFCGEKDVLVTHACKAKLAAFNFYCASCGRLAMAPEHVCKPTVVN